MHDNDPGTARPEMAAYIVCASFEGGTLCVSAIIAPSSEMAAAGSVAQFVQDSGTKGPLLGLAMAPLDVDFCRSVVRAAEGEKPGVVLSLASSRADKTAAEPDGASGGGAELMRGLHTRIYDHGYGAFPDPEPPEAA